MLAELFAFGLLRANLCAAVAILAVLAVRGPVRRRVGAQAAYALWAAVPAAMVLSAFPGLHLLCEGALDPAMPGAVSLPKSAAGIALVAWLAGSVVTAALFFVAERRFTRAAALGRAGPAVRGVLWPRLVTPADHETRFTPVERLLIEAHEREHIRRRDPLANLVLAALQVLAWFNPLIPVAAAAMRLDQEIACDAAVLARHANARPAYAAALLKAQVSRQERARVSGALGAAFGTAHPLEARLKALARPAPSRAAAIVGVAIAALPVAAMLCAWSLAPAAFRSANPVAGPRLEALLIDLTPRQPR